MPPKAKVKTKPTSRKVCNSNFSFITANIGWLNLSLAFILVFGIFFYLVQLSTSTTKGFAISELQKQVAQQEEDVRITERKIHKFKSVEHISQEAERLQMVAVGQVDFMQPLASGVALGE